MYQVLRNWENLPSMLPQSQPYLIYKELFEISKENKNSLTLDKSHKLAIQMPKQ